MNIYFDRNEKDIWRSYRMTGIWMTILSLACQEEATVEMCGKTYTLQRGQLATSLTRLSSEIGCSRPTLIKYLKMLEDEHELVRTTIGQKFAIYTICRFDYFFPLKQNKYSSCEEEKEKKEVYSSSYNKKKNISFGDFSLKSSSTKEKRESTPPDTKPELTYSEKKTREKEWHKEIENDTEVWNELSVAFGMPPEKILPYARQYFAECLVKDDFHESVSKVKGHFINWMKKSIEYQKKIATQSNTGSTVGHNPKLGMDAPALNPIRRDGKPRYFFNHNKIGNSELTISEQTITK